MASLPTPEIPAYLLCNKVGEQATLLMSKAIKTTTGLDLRTTGKGLLSGTGDLSVQVPRIVDGHRWTSPRTAGMVLRVSPRQTRWTPWLEAGALYREYIMGQAQTLTLAQRTSGRGGPIVGAKQLLFRLALRPGQVLQQAEMSPHASCHQHPAEVAVVVHTHPSTEAPRYWSEMRPEGGFLPRREGASPETTTTNSSEPSQQDESGQRDPGSTLLVHGRTAAGGVSSGGIPDVVPRIPMASTGRDDTSTQEGLQGQSGSTGGRTTVTISSSASDKRGRELVFQKLLLISVRGVWLIAQQIWQSCLLCEKSRTI